MIEAALRLAIERRVQVLLAVLLAAALGAWNFTRLNIDAVPDLTNTQVQVTTTAAGATPLEVESSLTLPVETALAGLPGLQYTRSQSRYGLSQVTAVFADDTDLYFARSQIAERLQAVREQLPAGSVPRLGPVATGLGEIVLYAITAADGARQPDGRPWDLAALRGLQDWTIRPQLLQVPGVSEINTTGGYPREFQVSPSPARLLAYGLGFAELAEAIARNNGTVGAGQVERNGEQVLIRVPGQLKTARDIADVVVSRRDGVPVRIGDVAEVGPGEPLRSSAALIDGREAVIGTVIMRIGENSRRVARAAEQRLEAIRASAPAGVHIEALYSRATLVDQTIDTVRTNLFEGAALVIAVLFVMLGNLRAALITAAVIPLAMLLTVTGMVQFGVSANLMSLGALDFGLIVDGAVIIVENCTRRLAEAQAAAAAPLAAAERRRIAHEAAREVIRPSLFGVAIITLVYLPIFAFEGAEARLFQPMAITVMLALAAAMLFSLSFVPAAIALALRHAGPAHERGLSQRLRRGYARLLQRALHRPLPWLAAALTLVIGSALLAPRLGAEFIPSLDEGDVLIEVRRIPGTSLSQGLALEKQLDQALGSLPEVRRVFAGMGTTEAAIDPTAPGEGETYVLMKPRSQWPDPDKPKAQLVRELQAAAATLPGTVTEFSQPVQLRINELLSGIKSAVAVKIHGDDLDTLARLGARVEARLARLPGAVDVRLEATDGLPLLTIEPKRPLLYRYGLNVADLQAVVADALAGRPAGHLVDGDRRHPIVIRLAEATRQDLRGLERLPVPLPGGGAIPLGEVATLVLASGPNQISRDNGKRRVIVTANVEGRDLAGFVDELRAVLARDIRLPPGVWLDYGGTYQQLVSAHRRLALIAPLTLAGIVALLWLAFGSLRSALLVFSGVPLALTGGVLALLARGLPFSITAGIGFIALSGVAILNGLVMLSVIDRLRDDGRALDEALLEGAGLRLRPVLMTALVASLGFLPMALNTGLGAEVQRPLATVVIGGIVSSTLLTLFVLPLLYRLVWRGQAAPPAAPASGA
ncbi:MAG: CusA/CzcA family heavy metal efflux RND transporter [Gammaproteobacteria bacterium]|nr:CusA/CzcA family heavy metal efflux RND transporter [Gammaproteobacteria bacterium]